MAATSEARVSGDKDLNPEADGPSMENDIKQLREDIAKLSEHMKKLGSRSVYTAQRAAKEGAQQLRGTAEDYQAELAEMVREKPFTALALAAGIGYLFALISRR